MNNIKISIIVAVYNAEKFLETCLNSIINQVYKDFECILVNDGSTDNSLLICEKYSQIDNRFIIINKKNGGVGSARNAALDIARGEWITFVDSDDWIIPEYIQLFITNSFSADLIIQGFSRHLGKNYSKNYIPLSIEITRKDILKQISYIYKYINSTIIKANSFKAYKNDIIKNNALRYAEDIRDGEDFLFILKYIIHVDKIKTIPVAGYNYITYNSTLTKKDNDAVLYFSWQKQIIKTVIDVNNALGPCSDFLNLLIIDLIQFSIKNIYLKNKTPKQERLNILAELLIYLNKEKNIACTNPYFPLRLHKIVSIRIIDLLFFSYFHLIGYPLRKLKHKLKI